VKEATRPMSDSLTIANWLAKLSVTVSISKELLETYLSRQLV
jgi:hypothetical protein